MFNLNAIGALFQVIANNTGTILHSETPELITNFFRLRVQI